MSKKVTVVLFEENRIPRIFINPSFEYIESLRKIGKVLINPRIPAGVEPSRWVLIDKRIQVGAAKDKVSSAVSVVKEIEVCEGPSYDDLHRLESMMETYNGEINRKYKKLLLMGTFSMLAMMAIEFRNEIQLLIEMINGR